MSTSMIIRSSPPPYQKPGLSFTFTKLAEQGGAVITGFFSEFVFELLRKRYRDELAFLIIMAAIVFWIHFQKIIMLMFGFFIENKDDNRWISVWERLINLVALTLVFIWGQYVIVLVKTEVLLNEISHAESILFIVMLLWFMYSYIVDSPDRYDRDCDYPSNDADGDIAMDIGAHIGSSAVFL